MVWETNEYTILNMETILLMVIHNTSASHYTYRITGFDCEIANCEFFQTRDYKTQSFNYTIKAGPTVLANTNYQPKPVGHHKDTTSSYSLVPKVSSMHHTHYTHSVHCTYLM